MRLENLFKTYELNEVFTAGGQPSVTYIARTELGIESAVRKAVSQPNVIASITGPTKSGKTVLCREVLNDYEYVWVEGGQIRSEDALWAKICTELKYPNEIKTKEGTTTQGSLALAGGGEAGIPVKKATFTLTASGSRLKISDEDRTYKLDNMHTALEHLLAHKICLVVDDFHYMPEAVRETAIRSLKGAVFRGLKVILLSTTDRAFEAIRAEPEITGRFKHVGVPEWSINDLELIASIGFDALHVNCPTAIAERFAREAEGSPLLMQQFCWNLCFDCGIERSTLSGQAIAADFDIVKVFREVATDSGLPIYEKLARGPQSRTPRIPRPLTNGESVDIYQAILLAVAVTGPKKRLSYDEIRASLNRVLQDKVPQKLEVSNALNSLSEIDKKENRGGRALDWDGTNLDLVINDPFFRFYLRWEVASKFKKATPA